MTLLGIILGLCSAAIQAFSFVFTRRFIVNGHGSVIRLLTQGHVIMGLAAAAVLPWVWDEHVTTWDWWHHAAGAGGFYIIGQVGFFIALGNSDASRVAPLLGLKIPAVAVLSMLLLGAHLNPYQWMAVGLSVSAAFLLNRIGGQLPWRTIGGVLFAVSMFALSDVFIVRMVDAMGEGFLAAARAVCLVYMMCGMVAVAFVPWVGSRKSAPWRATLPYTAAWLPSMYLFFASLWICQPVLGNIVIAHRGLFAIGLGALLAWAGHDHLETQASKSVVLRRAIAAVMMIGAIGLYGMS